MNNRGERPSGFLQLGCGLVFWLTWWAGLGSVGHSVYTQEYGVTPWTAHVELGRLYLGTQGG